MQKNSLKGIALKFRQEESVKSLEFIVVILCALVRKFRGV
jgi:hypothetical protein